MNILYTVSTVHKVPSTRKHRKLIQHVHTVDVQAHNMTDDKQTDIPHIRVQHTFVRMCLLW